MIPVSTVSCFLVVFREKKKLELLLFVIIIFFKYSFLFPSWVLLSSYLFPQFIARYYLTPNNNKGSDNNNYTDDTSDRTLIRTTLIRTIGNSSTCWWMKQLIHRNPPFLLRIYPAHFPPFTSMEEAHYRSTESVIKSPGDPLWNQRATLWYSSFTLMLVCVRIKIVDLIFCASDNYLFIIILHSRDERNRILLHVFSLGNKRDWGQLVRNVIGTRNSF